MSQEIKKTYLVYSQEGEDILNEIKKTEYISSLEPIFIDTFLAQDRVSSTTHVVVVATAYMIKQILKKAHDDGFSVSILSMKNQNTLRATFEIPSKLKDALEVALKSEPRDLDLLYANEEIVLWGALIGDAPPLIHKSDADIYNSFKERYLLMVEAFKKLKELKQTKIKLITKKEQEINTAASGIVIIEHDNHTFASSLVRDELSINDGKLSALLLSPTSIVDYLRYLYVSIFKTSKKSVLPNSVGFIRSESLSVHSVPPLPVKIDGEDTGETPIVFEIKSKAVKFSASEKFWARSRWQSGDKETVKLSDLPVTNETVTYAQDTLPFFTHASEDKYKDLFAGLREQSRVEPTFVTLMILSTILATVGLFLNSASVVIGAMLLAPLMQPIVSSAMGVLRSDISLFFNAFRTASIGVGLVLFTSAFIALVLPFENLTSEIAARLRPSLLDLIVALASGVAAAYAKNNEKIIGSLAGVAIAVALVPPLSSAGIGLGWMRFDIFYQAFLLFVTNFVGIIFAAALTFLVMGFAPIKRAKKGLTYALVTALVIAVPLYLSFNAMVVDSNIRAKLEQKEYIVANKEIKIENVVIKHRDKMVLKCDFIVSQTLNSDELAQLKEILENKLGMSIVLEIVQRVRF